MLLFALRRVAIGGQVLIPPKWIYDRSLVQTRAEQRNCHHSEPLRANLALNAPLPRG